MTNEKVHSILRKLKLTNGENDLCLLLGKENKILLDYITNLQEENERLKNELDNVKASYETEAEARYYEYIDRHESKLQERIDNAIEYIEKIIGYDEKLHHGWYDMYEEECCDVLKTLKGE